MNIIKRLKQSYKLEHYTVSFLAILLGFIGLTLTYAKAEEILKFPIVISTYLLYFTIFLSIIIVSIYLIKLILLPKTVLAEINHPIKLNFFPIISKLFLISSIIYLGLNLTVSKYLWWIGVVLQLFFTLYIMSEWIQHSKFNIKHINPSWFIPIVGSIIVPIAGVRHFSAEVSWFFFSIGLIWWMILFVIVINRMIFHDPIPSKLIPTFFILFAPPAIGFIAIVKLIGEITPFAKILYYFSLFMFILILCQIKSFTKIKFYLSWWAYSFPVVAITVATMFMYHLTELSFFKYFSWVLFIFLNIVMVVLVIRTVIAVRQGKICVKEED